MRKMLVALSVFFASMAFAQDGPSAQSLDVKVGTSSVNVSFLQDGDSFKPGFTWEREVYPRTVAGLAVLFDTTGQRVTAGPVLGYRLVQSQYVNITPLVGILQELDSNHARTRFVYGVEASVDLTSLLGHTQTPVSTNRASLMSVSSADLVGVGGLGIYTGYSLHNGYGVGVNYVVPLTDAIGVGPSLSVLSGVSGNLSGAVGVGVAARVWADQHNAVSLWGGADYSWDRNAVNPVVGLVYRNSGFDF